MASGEAVLRHLLRACSSNPTVRRGTDSFLPQLQTSRFRRIVGSPKSMPGHRERLELPAIYNELLLYSYVNKLACTIVLKSTLFCYEPLKNLIMKVVLTLNKSSYKISNANVVFVFCLAWRFCQMSHRIRTGSLLCFWEALRAHLCGKRIRKGGRSVKR